MKYYYTNAANQPVGPVTLEELQQLLARGEINLVSTNIVAVGETTWKPLNNLLGTPPAAAAAPAGSPPLVSVAPAPSRSSSPSVLVLPTLLATTVGKILDWVRGLFNPAWVANSLQSLKFIGQILVLAGVALTFIVAVVWAIKGNSFQVFLVGIGCVVAIVLLQYVAVRFLEACTTAVKNSPSRITSTAVPDCVALILLIAAVGVLVQSVVLSIQASTFLPLLPALGISLLLAGTAAVALNPPLAKVEIAGETSAGQEAIGLFAFITKTSLVLTPLVFALYAAAGDIVLIVSLFNSDSPLIYALAGFLPEPLRAIGGGMIGASVVATACVLPLAAYIGFLFYYLLIEVLQAILVIPSKLDALRR